MCIYANIDQTPKCKTTTPKCHFNLHTETSTSSSKNGAVPHSVT